MALAKEIEDMSEEDYMDDLIKIIHDDDDGVTTTPAHDDGGVKTTPVQQDTSAHSRDLVIENASGVPDVQNETEIHCDNQLPVTFFDSDKNVQLLNLCRPLYVKVDKQPLPKKKTSALRKIRFRSHATSHKKPGHMDLADNSTKNVFTCTLKQNNVLKITKNNIPSSAVFSDIKDCIDNQAVKKIGDSEKKKTKTPNNESETNNIDNDNNNTAATSKKIRQNKDFEKKIGLVSLKNPKSNKNVKKNLGLVGLKISKMNIDFKKNLGLIGLKISNSYVKPDLKKVDKEKKEINCTKKTFEEPEVDLVKKTDDSLSKNGIFENNISSENEMKTKDNKQKDSYCINIRSKLDDLIEKNNCRGPDLFLGKDNQRTEKNLKPSIEKNENEKQQEALLKCKLKLHPQIASKLEDKLNNEAKADVSTISSFNIHLVRGETGGAILNTCHSKENKSLKSNESSIEQKNDEDIQQKKNVNNTKMCDLKGQTAFQRSNSVSKDTPSITIAQNPNIDSNELTIFNEAQNQVKRKTENEIKKELINLCELSENPQNTLEGQVEQQPTISESSVQILQVTQRLEMVVKDRAQVNNQVISATGDPAIPLSVNTSISTSCSTGLDQNLSTNTMPSLNAISPSSNTLPVRSFPLNPLNSYPSTNNICHANGTPNSTSLAIQFLSQPNQSSLDANIQRSFDSDRFNNWQNQNVPSNINISALGQRMAHSNEISKYQNNSKNSVFPNLQIRNEPTFIPPSFDVFQNSANETPQLCRNERIYIPPSFDFSQNAAYQIPYRLLINKQTGSCENNYLNIGNDNYLGNPVQNDRTPFFSPPLPPGYSYHNYVSSSGKSIYGPPKVSQKPVRLKNSATLTNLSYPQGAQNNNGVIINSGIANMVPNKIDAKQACRRDLTDQTPGKNKMTPNTVEKKQASTGNLSVVKPENNKKTQHHKAVVASVKACIEGPQTKKIRLIPPQMSDHDYVGLTPESCSSHSDTSTNMVPASKGYSPPILPIPSVQKSIELMQLVNSMRNKRRIDVAKKSFKSAKTKAHVMISSKCDPNSTMKKATVQKELPNNEVASTQAIKKITLEEYKKRASKDQGNYIDLTGEMILFEMSNKKKMYYRERIISLWENNH